MGIDNTWSGSGNVGQNPELRFTNNGLAVASFAIAVYEGKDKQPSWYDITCWDKLAENVAETIEKGDRVTVVGRLTQDRWETADGDKRSKVKIVADDVAVSLKWSTATVNRSGDGGRDDDRRPARPAKQSRKPTQPVPDEEPF